MEYNVFLFHCFSYHYRLNGVTRWALIKTTRAMWLIVMNNAKATTIPTWSTCSRSSCYKGVEPGSQVIAGLDCLKCWSWSLVLSFEQWWRFMEAAVVAIYGSSSERLRIDRVRLNRTPFHASFFKKRKKKTIFTWLIRSRAKAKGLNGLMVS